MARSATRSDVAVLIFAPEITSSALFSKLRVISLKFVYFFNYGVYTITIPAWGMQRKETLRYQDSDVTGIHTHFCNGRNMALRHLYRITLFEAADVGTPDNSGRMMLIVLQLHTIGAWQ